jgi:hypothetical protein
MPSKQQSNSPENGDENSRSEMIIVFAAMAFGGFIVGFIVGYFSG